MIVPALTGFACDPVDWPEDVGSILRASALDWIAVGLAGAQEPVSRLIRAQAYEEGGAPQASVFGAVDRVPARAAALVNGTTAHALDYDDTHFDHIGHPSVAVFPAALALSERRGATVQDWLEAALVGMEASIRVGLWLGRGHYQIGFHQTATAGAFGAVIASARLLRLDREQAGHALGLVSTRASGLKAQFGTMGKPLNAGLAASAGVEAALWARSGMISSPDAVAAFGATHHGAGSEAMLNGLGTTWRFLHVSHKFHACCHGLHAALEALEGVPAPDVKAIAVHTHPRWMPVCNRPDPDTGLGMKFSYKAALAARLGGLDTSRLDTFSDANARDASLVALRAKVEVIADEDVGEMQARLLITYANGTSEERFHDLAAPVPIARRCQKIRDKARILIGASADGIRATLEQDGPIDTISDWLQKQTL